MSATLRTALAGFLLAGCADTATSGQGEGPTFPDGPSGTSVGDLVADYALTDCGGAATRLGAFHGEASAVWLTLHSVHCQVCASQHAFLRDFHERYGSRGVVVLMVLGDSRAPGPEQLTDQHCATYATEEDLAFPILRDEGFIVTASLADRGVPYQLLLDASFVIRAAEPGWDPSFQEERFERLVDEVLEEQEE